ncbi:regulatory protein RecX [Gephyromycinifex aptenodytis]|uniref:regulatory protein RecX n=1 Tax=Gephyromycinifex aptenodytis TaxID=2716227 RepID=UPI001446FADC|nr:regulatory protein RecX [Gephyromycinifex aptenodytis]
MANGDTQARLAQARRVLAQAQAAASTAASPDDAGSPVPPEPPLAREAPALREEEESFPVDPAVQPDDADAQAVARQIVLRQLAMAPRSRKQLEDKLRSRGCQDDVAAAVLDRFAEVGLVDDEAFAEVLVRSQQLTRGLSRRALAHELTKKGVERHVRDAALADIAEEDERARAEQLVATRLKRLAGLPREVQTRRLSGMLARKGYPPGLSYAVIREALDASAEHRRD